ncbi:helix-turn-helix domain-containing protein [Streptomyces anulatus]|uniref:helix-turn-helix domain-containing protein n=1 Tax=Streptomyces TaxID=1883 RepID=UPI000BF127F2|nr:helix-turn-helix transcriptional regulator [Streptomyces sp. b62]
MKSLYERFASSDDGSQLLAAARLRRELLRVLHKGLEACGLTQSELAQRLGVRKSAVSQALRGDGNLRVNTIASYLSAMGYELDVRLVEAGEPRKAVTEGREMVPAFKRDWIPVERSQVGTISESQLALNFAHSQFTVTLVEMRAAETEPFEMARCDFEGAAQSSQSFFVEPGEFRPIRIAASS